MSSSSLRKHTSLPMIVVFAVLSLCGCGSLEVKSRTWQAMNDPAMFPERRGEYRIAYLDERESLGVAISGGGTRSAAAAVGQLRALKELGYLDRARYISAASGGAWAAVPYTYRSSMGNFLGDYTPPENISEETLTEPQPPQSLPRAISEIGYILPQILSQGWRGNEAYAQTIGKYFASPFQIDRKALFTFDNDILSKVSEYQGTDFPKDKFVTVSPNSNPPYLLVSGTVLVPHDGRPVNIYPLEVTPLYVGVRGQFADVGIGGGYIESFAYDGVLKSEAFSVEQRQTYSIKNKASRFSLADVLGVTGAAPVQALESSKFLLNFWFPKYRYQPIAEKGQPIDKLVHGDGGHMDNLALMPLFLRGLENIIVFVNSRDSFHVEGDSQLPDDVRAYFGVGDDVRRKFPYNNVIIDGPMKYEGMVNALIEQKQDGRPLAHCDKYRIKSSERYAFYPAPNYEPTICWVVLDRVGDWLVAVADSENVDREGKRLGQLLTSTGDFQRFPHFRTFFEDPEDPNVIDLEVHHVNALSDLTHWSVLESAAMISDSFGWAD